MNIAADFPIARIEATWLAVFALSAFLMVATQSLARIFPRVFAAFICALIAWIAGVALLTAHFPALLHLLTVLTVLGMSAAVWRARSGYGRSRRLPPGSLSLSASIRALADREFYRKQAARYGPIFKVAQFYNPVVCIVGLSRGHRLLHEQDEALGPATQRFSQYIPDGFLRYMDDQTHDIYGPLFRQALSGSIVAHSRPVILEAAGHELAQAAADARKSKVGAIPPNPCLARIVTAAFFRVLFGIAPRTSAFEELSRAYQPLAPLVLSARQTGADRAALEGLRRLITAQYERWCCQADSDETPVCALSELGRLQGRTPDTTSVDNLVYIHKIASSNVADLMRWLLVMLGRHPAWIGRLRTELAGPAQSGPPLVDRIIMETLRLSQAEDPYRRLHRDVVFDGFTLPKGWFVRICVWESHRDGESFSDPEQFDPNRFLSQDYSRSTYSPFGVGRHACNGVPLTNVICRAFLEELTSHYNWSVDRHEELGRDFRHWSHWRPSARLRLRLDPIQSSAQPASVTSPG